MIWWIPLGLGYLANLVAGLLIVSTALDDIAEGDTSVVWGCVLISVWPYALTLFLAAFAVNNVFVALAHWITRK